MSSSVPLESIPLQPAGADVLSDSSHVYVLTDDEAAALEQLAVGIAASPYTDPGEFAVLAHLAAGEVPRRLRRVLYEFEGNGSPTGTFLIRRLPVGPLPETPTSTASTDTGRTIGARASAVLMACLGHLVGYRPENAGRILQTVVPNQSDGARQVSSGYGTDLESHTEQCFNQISRPDYVGLMTLRGDPRAATYALTARQVFEGMTGRQVHLLRQSAFTMSIDESFVAGGLRDEVRGPIAVLTGPDDDPRISYDQDLMTGVDDEHTAVLADLAAFYNANKQPVVLADGDMLVIDNARAIHGRSTFTPRFDGTDRWLARSFGVTSLTASRIARPANTRTIEAFGC